MKKDLILNALKNGESLTGYEITKKIQSHTRTMPTATSLFRGIRDLVDLGLILRDKSKLPNRYKIVK
jgi:DNA-binding PadR family transcriptional regulator